MAAEKVLPKPVDWDELYPGRFLKAGEFKGAKVTLRISSVDVEELIGDKGAQIKGIISFEKTDKKLALNRTNGICLKEMFGKKLPEWVGKRVTLFPSQWNGEDCIRVWGSPDIAADREITVTLPRKRPMAMTMHKTAGPSAAKPASTDTTEPPSGFDAAATEKKLRASKSLEELGSIWITVQARHKGREIPIELEAAFTDMRESLDAGTTG